ncbi:MAG: helix-turn-helix transcriptional regulator [Bdellovibrionaceae bacterium]|nr:helix-turn-helix transcriptional regulator [Pseudobdellovibrionaceae bacterium]
MIKVKLAVLLAQKEMKLKDLEEKTGIALNNLSVLKTGKAKAIRFSTLEEICRALDCQPGDLLEYVPGATPDDDDETED